MERQERLVNLSFCGKKSSFRYFEGILKDLFLRQLSAPYKIRFFGLLPIPAEDRNRQKDLKEEQGSQFLLFLDIPF